MSAKIERIIWENVIGHDTVQTEDIKQQVKLLKNENNRLRMEPESLLKVIELLSVQQVNTLEINDNTEIKETSKNKKTKLNLQQDYRIPLRNSFETLSIKECQDKPGPTNEENSMSPSFDHVPIKRRQKQSTKQNKQPQAYITNE